MNLDTRVRIVDEVDAVLEQVITLIDIEELAQFDQVREHGYECVRVLVFATKALNEIDDLTSDVVNLSVVVRCLDVLCTDLDLLVIVFFSNRFESWATWLSRSLTTFVFG